MNFISLQQHENLLCLQNPSKHACFYARYAMANTHSSEFVNFTWFNLQMRRNFTTGNFYTKGVFSRVQY